MTIGLKSTLVKGDTP